MERTTLELVQNGYRATQLIVRFVPAVWPGLFPIFCACIIIYQHDKKHKKKLYIWINQ